jgi:dipeptidyl aminopeptidase/acylaminoacyl peptidase
MSRLVRGALTLWMSLASLTGQDAPRPMTVEDLFTLSELGSVALSPGGEWIAATVTRPGSPNGCPTCNYKAAGDVWLINRRTGEPRNLTDGAADASSSWLPTWSPDGRRLAFVSTRPEGGEPRGGDNIRLYVWDSSTDTLTRLGERGVYLQIDVRMPARSPWPMAWLDDTVLLAALLPEGVAADEQILYWRRAVAESTRAWAKGMDGTVPTASVLESGGPVASPLPTVSLQRIDVSSQTGLTLAELPKWDLWDLSLNMQVAVSPDLTRAAALVVTGTIELRPDRPITGALRTYRAGVLSLDDSAPLLWTAATEEREHVGGQILGWSEDSRQCAISEEADPGTPGRGRRALIVSALDGSVSDVTPPGMSMGAAVWTSAGALLARARTADAAQAPLPTPSRWDWWRIGETGPPVNVTASMAEAPSRLLATHVADRFVGISQGALWAVDAGQDAAICLTAAEFPGGSLRALGPKSSSGTETSVLVQARDGDRPTLARITLADLTRSEGVTVRRIAYPTETAAFLECDPRAEACVFSDETPAGTFLWGTDGRGEQVVRALALNEHVAGIAEGRRMLVPYRSADGELLQGLVILPPGYEEGRRYPVATWVYGGLVLRDTRTPLASKHSTRPLNLEILAGHGLVVLLPSIPMADFGVKSDPWLDIPKAVLPCVDKLVELGIADPDRLAVMGHSTGGYSTYAVVTYTNRFKAAIALSGHPDLISLHGQLYPGERMNDRAHEGLAMAEFVEYGPMNLGGPPSEDLWRYLRNSPLFYLDRIRTPLMIVHGDMDGAPIQQGEQAFTGLYRLGRRARFVRYWGEGHVVCSPANVRHLWAQMFDWLDTHLGPTVELKRR